MRLSIDVTDDLNADLEALVGEDEPFSTKSDAVRHAVRELIQREAEL